MKNFEYVRADDAEQAVKLLSENPNARLLGGGTNLVDLMRENIEQPDVLIDVTSLPQDKITERPDGGFLIGAEVRNTAIVAHEGIRKYYPLVAEAVLAGASGQIRNMATASCSMVTIGYQRSSGDTSGPRGAFIQSGRRNAS